MSKDTFNASFYDVLRAVEPHRPPDWLFIACLPGKGKDKGNLYFRVITVAKEQRTPAENKMLTAISTHFFRGGKPDCAITERVLKMDDAGETTDEPLSSEARWC